jgi:hypothetical protein
MTLNDSSHVRSTIGQSVRTPTSRQAGIIDRFLCDMPVITLLVMFGIRKAESLTP